VSLLSQTVRSKVGKKGAVYIPKRVFERMGLKAGDPVLMRVEDDKLVLEFIPDPLSLALKARKWTKTDVKEFERESEGEQDALYTP